MKIRKLLTNKYYNIGNGSFWKNLFPIKQPNTKITFSCSIKNGLWIIREHIDDFNGEVYYASIILRITLFN